MPTRASDKICLCPKPPLWGTYNGKPMANTYLHNCMMDRATMLKFGKLCDLAKYMLKFQCTSAAGV